MIADEVVNKVYVQAGTIRADRVFTAFPGLPLRQTLTRIQFAVCLRLRPLYAGPFPREGLFSLRKYKQTTLSRSVRLPCRASSRAFIPSLSSAKRSRFAL